MQQDDSSCQSFLKEWLFGFGMTRSEQRVWLSFHNDEKYQNNEAALGGMPLRTTQYYSDKVDMCIPQHVLTKRTKNILGIQRNGYLGREEWFYIAQERKKKINKDPHRDRRRRTAMK